MKQPSGFAAVAVAVFVAGCAAAPVQPSARCEPVSGSRTAWILGSAGGINPQKAGAVRSLDHSNAYYVAIRFTGPGLGDEGRIGVWASSGDIETGAVVSVDAMAESFSGIPKHDSFSTTDRGADEARTCV